MTNNDENMKIKPWDKRNSRLLSCLKNKNTATLEHLPPGGRRDTNSPPQTIENPHRTNNIMEGWNLGFVSLVGCTHPSVRNLIKKLRADAHLSLTHVQQHNRGDPFKKTKEGIRSFLDANAKFMPAVISARL